MNKLYVNNITKLVFSVIGEGTSDDGIELFTIVLQGGGFVWHVSREDFLSSHTPYADDLDTLKKALVMADWLEGVQFMGYITDQRWNGWAMPWLTRDQCKMVASVLPGIRVLDDFVEYTDENYPEGGPELWPFLLKQTPDGPIWLCQLGDGWTWDAEEMK